MFATDVELLEEIYRINTPKYFVAAIGYNGSHHYSETVTDYEEAYELFETYKSVIDYVSNGGQVVLYGERYGEPEIIEKDWVI